MNISLFELFQRGGPVMWANLFCSVIALAIVLERLLALYRADINTARFLEEIEKSVRMGRFAEAEKLCDENPSPLARVVKEGLARHAQPRAEILEAMQEVVLTEISGLQNHTPLLGSIAHSALLLGLLGTVAGLIHYFQIIQLKATTINPVSPGDLAGGIWEALLNTAFGLIVAIPAYAMYNYLAHKTNVLSTQLDIAATHLSRYLAEERTRATDGSSSFSKTPNLAPTHAL